LLLAKENDRVLLIAADGKRHISRLHAGGRFHAHGGAVEHDVMTGKPLGCRVSSHFDSPLIVLCPPIHDLLMNVKRASQIVYPRDIAQSLLDLDIAQDKRIVESGTENGTSTVALAHNVCIDGMIASFDVG